MNDAKWACYIIFDNLIPTKHISIASQKNLPQNWQVFFHLYHVSFQESNYAYGLQIQHHMKP